MVTKDGFHKGIQRYKCAVCKKRFLGGERHSNEAVWIDYVKGKQTYSQLAVKYGSSTKTIQRKIDSVIIKHQTIFPSIANVLIDTTYFGKKFGVMVFKDSISGQVLFKKYVKHETNNHYFTGIEEISRRGIKVQSIICDGRKGLFQLFKDIPVQMCNFHQMAIIRKYLTKKPKLQASKELWEHVLLLTKTDKESFEGGLVDWYYKWESFLNERKHDEKGKYRFIHRRLRSAYRSLKTNLPWLFSWYDNIDLGMPNTTNALDGQFADLKNKLRNHNGLSVERKKRFINEFFKA